MIIGYGKAEHYTQSALVFCRKLGTTQQRLGVVNVAFYFERGVRSYAVCAHFGIARGYKRVGVHIEGAKLGLNPAGEKRVETLVILFYILRHIYAVLFYVLFNAVLAKPAVHVFADEFGNKPAAEYSQ